MQNQCDGLASQLAVLFRHSSLFYLGEEELSSYAAYSAAYCIVNMHGLICTFPGFQVWFWIDFFCLLTACRDDDSFLLWTVDAWRSRGWELRLLIVFFCFLSSTVHVADFCQFFQTREHYVPTKISTHGQVFEKTFKKFNFFYETVFFLI